jgi:hypothetical protein
VHYHLNHIPSSFCFHYFQIRFCNFAWGWSWTRILLHEPPRTPCSWDHRCMPPHLAGLLRWGFSSFLHGLVSNCDPSKYILGSRNQSKKYTLLCLINNAQCQREASRKGRMTALTSGHVLISVWDGRSPSQNHRTFGHSTTAF